MAQKKAKKAEPRENVIVQSKVKEYIRGKDMMSASDLVAALNEEVYSLIDRAIKRAEANGRKTTRADDV